MEIRLATAQDMPEIIKYDRHIPQSRLEACIREGRLSVLLEAGEIAGVLRWSLFWETIPFLDLILIDEACRGKGMGTEMMDSWEGAMADRGYRYVMLSTQADETAKQFYEKLGYRAIGAFLPPEQEAEERMYLKELRV